MLPVPIVLYSRKEMLLKIIFSFIFAYLLGSIPFASLVTKLIKKTFIGFDGYPRAKSADVQNNLEEGKRR